MFRFFGRPRKGKSKGPLREGADAEGGWGSPRTKGASTFGETKCTRRLGQKKPPFVGRGD